MVSARELAKHLQSSWPSQFKAECPSGFSGTPFRNHRDGDTSLPAPGLPSFHSPSLRCLIHSDTSPPSLLSTRFPDPAICQTTAVAPAPPPGTSSSTVPDHPKPLLQQTRSSSPPVSPPNGPISHHMLVFNPIYLLTWSHSPAPKSLHQFLHC